jgi:hypothetical protein
MKDQPEVTVENSTKRSTLSPATDNLHVKREGPPTDLTNVVFVGVTYLNDAYVANIKEHELERDCNIYFVLILTQHHTYELKQQLVVTDTQTRLRIYFPINLSSVGTFQVQLPLENR